MKKILLFLILGFSTSPLFSQDMPVAYQPITIDFPAEYSYETAGINPFTDYNLTVTFKNENQYLIIPGYYAADGNAAESSASEGNIWRAHFTPPSTGTWTYEVSFRKGKNVAISSDGYQGEPVLPHHGRTGEIQVEEVPTNAMHFRKSGRLQYHHSRYLHTQDGKVFLKFGANSPENFFAYADVDNTYSYHPDFQFLKTWEPHIKDWKEGNPTWQNGKGKGIIGALNYLASKGMNSVYALTFNIEGDAKDVWPYISHHRKDFLRFDVSKLAQWDIIISHAESLGIIIHLVTQEKENELVLDNGFTVHERKIYYRELIARFAHHNNIIWNMGEENGSASWWPAGQNDQQRFSMIRFINEMDAYGNPIVLHTLPEQNMRKPILDKLLGYDQLDGLSFQGSNIRELHDDIIYWQKESRDRQHSRPWIIMMDEIGPWHTGTPRDADYPSQDSLRQMVLWGTMMAGAAGVEWYFGWLKPPHDLNAEDWRSRNNIWEQSSIAHQFFKRLPIQDMRPNDDLVTTKNGYCLSKEGVYIVYHSDGGKLELDLSAETGNFSIRWYNPRVQEEMHMGSVESVKGGRIVSLGNPPKDPNRDWAILLLKY